MNLIQVFQMAQRLHCLHAIHARHMPTCHTWNLHSMDWFKGKFTGKPPYFMGKSMVSGSDFPKKTNPLIWANYNNSLI